MGQDLTLLTDISIALDPLLVNAQNDRDLIRKSSLARAINVPGFDKIQQILNEGRCRLEGVRQMNGKLGHGGIDIMLERDNRGKIDLLQGRRGMLGTRLAVRSLHAGDADKLYISSANLPYTHSSKRKTLDFDTQRSYGLRSLQNFIAALNKTHDSTSKPKLLERLINGVTRSRSNKSCKNSSNSETCSSAEVSTSLSIDNGYSSYSDIFETDELNTWKDNQITKSLLAEITENLSKCGSCSPKFLHHSRWRCSSPNEGAYSHPTSPDAGNYMVNLCKTTGTSSISAPSSPYIKHNIDSVRYKYQYHSVYNTDKTFKQAVMDKGYVKAMVDVLNLNKSKHNDVEHIEKKGGLCKMRDIYVTKFENANFVSCSSDLSSRGCDNRSEGQASTGTDDSGVQLNDNVFSETKDLSKRSSGICFFTTNDGMLQSPAELFDKSWCDSKNIYESDLSDESDCDEKMIADDVTQLSCVTQNEVQVPKDDLEGSHPGDKLFNIVYELLKTERAYVERLHLVDQVFHVRVVADNEQHNILPPDVIPRMFSNIHSIFQFHSEFLLPALEARIKQWDSVPKIGDLMKKNGPFLKLYSEYVRNFDHAMTLVNQWANKSPKFVDIMNRIHKMPECGHLSLQHHMLEPIQRVPRYELLLKDYLRHLPPQSSDTKDTQDALKLVTTAARHSNEAMRKLEGFRKLLEIHQSLGGSVDLISPTRELIKEGKIMKISARREKTQERYILLFNDIILICSEHLLGTYRVRAKLDVTGMQVGEGENKHMPHTFKVRSKQKSIEFQAVSIEECEDWIMIIQQTIEDLNKKKELRGKLMQESEVGCMAPEWVRDEAVTMCMRCTAPFTAFRRRHHCRACGIVICGKCSSRRLALSYDENKLNRVCDECYRAVRGSVDEGEGEDGEVVVKHRLRMKANDPGVVISGYLSVSNDHGKSWSKRWTVIHESFVLYLYKAHQDVCALMSLPLPGYQVSAVTSEPETFRLFHQNTSVKVTELIFTVETQSLCERWIEVLAKVVQAELPSEQCAHDIKQERLSSGSESSTASGDIKPT